MLLQIVAKLLKTFKIKQLCIVKLFNKIQNRLH